MIPQTFALSFILTHAQQDSPLKAVVFLGGGIHGTHSKYTVGQVSVQAICPKPDCKGHSVEIAG
jgi:hypothetical protein